MARAIQSVIFVLLHLVALGRAGPSGLNFVASTPLAGDLGLNRDVCNQVNNCDSCSIAQVVCPTSLNGFRGKIINIPFFLYGTLTNAGCPNPAVGSCQLANGPSYFTSCISREVCTFIASNNYFPNPCPGTSKVSVMIATCGQFQRSNVTSVWRTSASTPAYWSTGNAVWASTNTGRADEGLARRVQWPAVDAGFQQHYTQVWTFGSNMYILLGDQSRIYEIPIPTALTDIGPSNGQTAISESPNAFVSAIHLPRAGNADGQIYVATANGGVGLWTKSSGVWGKIAQYTIPTCGASPCFRLQPGSVITSPNHVYFGASLGRVIRISRTDASSVLSGTEQITAAAGAVSSLAYYVSGNTEYLYVGSSIGLVFQYSITSNRINALSLVSNPASFGSAAVSTVIVDSASGGILAAANDGSRSWISRLRADDQIVEQIDTELVPEVNSNFFTSSVRALHVDLARNSIVVGSDQPAGTTFSQAWDQPPRVHRFNLAQCNSYSCDQCGVRDPNYCGYCPSTDSCALIPSLSPGSCANSLTVSQCPVFTSISKTSGSSAGGTSVVFRGTNLFLSGPASDYVCTFSTTNVTATSVSSAGVTCLAPDAGANPINTDLPVYLNYRGRRLPSSADVFYRYIQCSSLTCSSCFDSGDCVWCYKSGQCAGTAECSGPRSTTACPSLSSLLPTSLSVRSTQNLVVSLNDAPLTENYRCDFNGLTTTAVPISGNRVNCSLPVGISAGFLTPTIQIESSTPGTFLSFTQSANPSAILDIYDCDAISACFTCVSNHPDCGYCKVTPFTAGGCSYNNTAAFTGPDYCSVLNSGSCPKITATSPPTIHYIADAGTTVDATLADVAVANNPSNFICKWLFSNRTEIDSSAALTGTTRTLAKCRVPSVSLPTGSVFLEIFDGSNALTNAQSVSVYNCAGGTSCLTCTSSIGPKCAWCNALLLCEAPEAIPGGCASGSSCPTAVAFPQSDAVQGGSLITIIPTPYPNATAGICRFLSADQSVDLSSGANGNGTAFTCLTPRVASPASLRLRFEIAGTLYAAPTDFEYYDCAFTPSAVPRTCSDCVPRPGCSWCGSSCSARSVCDGPLQVCPKVIGVTPDVVDAMLPSFVTIRTSVDAPNAFNYDCIFGSDRSPGTAIVGGVRCLTPNVFTGTPEGSPLSVSVGIRDIASGSWSTNLANEAVALKFFRCSSSANSCGGQCASTYCGFCLDQGKCSGQQACLLDSPNAIWLNGSSTDSCPGLESFQPDYMQVAIRNRTLIPEQISFRVRSLTLPSPVNVTLARRDISLSDFACVFGSDIVPVDSYDATTNTFRCTAPVLFNQGFYSVFITYKGARLTADDNRFQVQDCFRLPACSICLLQPNCGWCRGSVRCMTKAWCDQEPINEWGPVCPGLTSLSPTTGLISGEYPLTISGGPFVDSPQLAVVLRFPSTNITLNATRTNENTLTVTIPAAPASFEGEVKVAVVISGVDYIPSTLSFTYLAPSSSVVGVSGGAVAGIIVAAAVIVLALIAALLFMRSRKVGLFAEFKLTPPNYAEVAFGSMLQPQYKMPKDNYEILAIKLLSKDHSFVFSVMGFTAATEQDPVARALTHFFDWHKKSVEYGVLFVSDEVKRNKSENTIFRNNSMASKWFKFYSKIVGVEYLFNELARFIYELNKISEARSAQSGDDSSGKKPQLSSSKSLLSLEMEVDPNKFGDGGFTDSEANVYQLILACQKVFTAIRTSIKSIPVEFKIVFQGMREAIMNKFNSEDAILKAIGGFFYLRFICPAITAPHAYGLLQDPPNAVAQRQLVLIGKVIQNLANMTMPGAKEEFMQQLNDFFSRNIPKMKLFYTEILQENTNDQEETTVVETTDAVRHNALAYLWSHIHTNRKKLEAQFKVEADGDETIENELHSTLAELMENYPKAPKKIAEADKEKGKGKDE